MWIVNQQPNTQAPQNGIPLGTQNGQVVYLIVDPNEGFVMRGTPPAIPDMAPIIRTAIELVAAKTLGEAIVREVGEMSLDERKQLHDLVMEAALNRAKQFSGYEAERFLGPVFEQVKESIKSKDALKSLADPIMANAEKLIQEKFRTYQAQLDSTIQTSVNKMVDMRCSQAIDVLVKAKVEDRLREIFTKIKIDVDLKGVEHILETTEKI